MITLPTRRMLISKRNRLHKKLLEILPYASVHRVEDIQRKIHMINFRLKNYFSPKKKEEDNEDW